MERSGDGVVGIDRAQVRTSWVDRVFAIRDRLLANPAFHRWAASFPLTRPVARRQTQLLFDLCAGFSCQTKLPPYDRLVGNVSVEYALEQFADGNGPGARVAAVGLANMRKAHP